MPLIIVNYSSRRRKSGEKVHSHASPKEKKSVPHLKKKKEQNGKTNALVMLPPPPVQSNGWDLPSPTASKPSFRRKFCEICYTSHQISPFGCLGHKDPRRALWRLKLGKAPGTRMSCAHADARTSVMTIS